MDNLGEIYLRGKQTLDDMRQLGESSNLKLVDQLSFYFEQIHFNKIKKNNFSNLIEYISNCFIKDLSRQIAKKTKVRKVSFCKTNSLYLENWDKVIQCSSVLTELLNLFNYVEDLKISFENKKVDICGRVNTKYWDPNIKSTTYSIMRELLKSKILLTYQVEGKVKSDLFDLKLSLDYSHNDQIFYEIDSKQLCTKICFSNVFANYESQFKHIKAIKKHTVILLDYQLNLSNLDEIPPEYLDYELKYPDHKHPMSLIHFPFLFHPISLIIPIGGKVVSAYRFDGETTNSSKSNYVDIFELLDN